jgi:hypothetical protein
MMNEQSQEQLELGLPGSNRLAPETKPARRHTRASWWFNQMRQLVESATDWEPAPRFAPEQNWLPVSAQSSQDRN